MAIEIRKIRNASTSYGDRAKTILNPSRYGVFRDDDLVGYISADSLGYNERATWIVDEIRDGVIRTVRRYYPRLRPLKRGEKSVSPLAMAKAFARTHFEKETR